MCELLSRGFLDCDLFRHHLSFLDHVKGTGLVEFHHAVVCLSLKV